MTVLDMLDQIAAMDLPYNCLTESEIAHRVRVRHIAKRAELRDVLLAYRAHASTTARPNHELMRRAEALEDDIRLLADAYRSLLASLPVRTCDCGAALTQCSTCAVGDYQAAHPECSTCCKAPALPVRTPEQEKEKDQEMDTRLDSSSCKSSTGSDAGKDTVTPPTVSNNQVSNECPRCEREDAVEIKMKACARHNHEQGAPLTDDCDGWCRCKAETYRERTATAEAASVSEEQGNGK